MNLLVFSLATLLVTNVQKFYSSLQNNVYQNCFVIIINFTFDIIQANMLMRQDEIDANPEEYRNVLNISSYIRF